MMQVITRRTILAGVACGGLTLALGAGALGTIPSPSLSTSMHDGPMPIPASGRIVRHAAMASRFVAARHVDVWLPEGYQPGKGWRALYMHDGQNLFDARATPFGEWGVDEVMAPLLANGTIEKTIIVAVWNSPQRARDYMPAAAFEALPEEGRAAIAADMGGPPLSDGYVRFLAEEVKPFIDKAYGLAVDAPAYVMGSSMGGLISLYCLMRRPDLFKGAGCLSTHWPLSVNRARLERSDPWQQALARGYIDVIRAILPSAGPSAGKAKLYFDFGTQGLDRLYEPYQRQVDAIMREKGYREGVDWMTVRHEGADHNEIAWRARLADPLRLLLAANR
jgi:enterochelin esterase-like enzyme